MVNTHFTAMQSIYKLYIYHTYHLNVVLDLIAIFTIRPKPDIRLLKYPDIRYQV